MTWKQSGILGWRIDHKKIEQELEKLKKTLNLQNASGGGLFDPETATEEELKIAELQNKANEQLNEGVLDSI